MWKLKISPKVIRATEKYIASIGIKREELTEEQWNLLLDYVKNRRIVIPIFVLIMLFCSSMTFLFWHLGHKCLTGAITNHTVQIATDNQREPISLSPEEIREYFDYLAGCYMNAGINFMLAFYTLIFLIGSITLVRIQNRKTHRILLSRPNTKEVVV
jgi:hypothetical protein